MAWRPLPPACQRHYQQYPPHPREKPNLPPNWLFLGCIPLWLLAATSSDRHAVHVDTCVTVSRLMLDLSHQLWCQCKSSKTGKRSTLYPRRHNVASRYMDICFLSRKRVPPCGTQWAFNGGESNLLCIPVVGFSSATAGLKSPEDGWNQQLKVNTRLGYRLRRGKQTQITQPVINTRWRQ